MAINTNLDLFFVKNLCDLKKTRICLKLKFSFLKLNKSFHPGGRIPSFSLNYLTQRVHFATLTNHTNFCGGERSHKFSLYDSYGHRYFGGRPLNTWRF